MIESDEHLRCAWEFVEHTGVSIFLTGKAGTGKTTFLKEVLRRSAKTAVVVAPTGVAAINAGGVTIHSFFQLSPAPYIPGTHTQDRFSFSKQKLRVIRGLDLLVIDEISMVRADLLDAIDNALRKYRRDGRPFGGVQLLMIGDLQQLAPVVTPADEAILRQHYPTPYFFSSKALSEIQYVTISLGRVFRQQNADFVRLLNHVRDNCLTPEDRGVLRSLLKPTFIPEDGSGYIRLTTHNAQAESYNETRMRSLPTSPVRYKAKVSGTFPELAYPTAQELVIKPGAQVMFVKNDTVDHQYYNGLIGTVTYADREKVAVKVADAGGGFRTVTVAPQVWENTQYTVNEQTNTIETQVQGRFSQIPLRPAWAITIHKSQGLTFDRVIIDAGASFAPGQTYVALSRCRSLDGLVLSTPIAEESLRPDPSVAVYISGQSEAGIRSVAALERIKVDYHRQMLIDLFTFRDVYFRSEGVYRHIGASFANSFANEYRMLAETIETLRSKIIAIADKWTAQIRLMPPDQLVDQEFLLRVRKSCVYFYNQLVEIYGYKLSQLDKVRTKDKRANSRMSELVAELRQAIHTHLYILRDINDRGFTVAGYLSSKQQAVMKATKEQSAPKKAASTKNSPSGEPRRKKKSFSPKTYADKTERELERERRRRAAIEAVRRQLDAPDTFDGDFAD